MVTWTKTDREKGEKSDSRTLWRMRLIEFAWMKMAKQTSGWEFRGKITDPRADISAFRFLSSLFATALLLFLRSFSVLLFLLLFTLHPVRIAIPPPTSTWASITRIYPANCKSSGHKQKLVSPWCSSFLSHKDNSKNIAYCFTVPFFFFTSVSHSHLITTLVPRKDKYYCSHFKEEETEAETASDAHPNNLRLVSYLLPLWHYARYLNSQNVHFLLWKWGQEKYLPPGIIAQAKGNNACKLLGTDLVKSQ